MKLRTCRADSIAGAGHPWLCRAKGGLGFNGWLHEPGLAWQLLGHGYRAYNPALMRFHSPDNQSPFAQGGLNAYAYCRGDPLNRTDPSGHGSLFDPLLRHFTTASSKAGKVPKLLRKVSPRKSKGDKPAASRFRDITGQDINDLRTLKQLFDQQLAVQRKLPDTPKALIASSGVGAVPNSVPAPSLTPAKLTHTDIQQAYSFALVNVGNPGITRHSRAQISQLAEQIRVAQGRPAGARFP
ncbi:RHS repeat-associated core domain-containing protein [Pseudomonas sp. DTU_2021_1001937_2_SI_NGA_ILE_001]|uniref:RHS repeat-associated core domain-containing protein n=1 Tax=Pseudomonas sp. DTU_2021_1001937_2_SI_NGA_ILE_001 TaxID=3077589 RepID=UPI0028FC2D1A|nr:RHS repeat-associated core domain-containing protein [Pseudomonas sp. DTU_2021_1001937_2_SI_NGA_ILE_001]WNW10754.1 RHS repeat-associated core domain-containing protein [Pseudomonas sp. DTU_2021_1001937_2_SI_NGA_ILE_001]